MLKRLIKLANRLDSEGAHKKADHIDRFIAKFSQANPEEIMDGPTDEDLLETETWLDESGIPDELETDLPLADELQDIAYQLESWKQILEGSDPGEAKRIADHMVQTLQQKIMILTSPASIQNDSLELLPFQRPIEIEAAIRTSLSKIAEIFDSNALYRSADFCDKLLARMASNPDDPDDDISLDDFDEPTTDELLKLEDEELENDSVDRIATMMAFISAVANGEFQTMESAQAEAKQIMDTYEQLFGEEDTKSDLPDNVIPLFG